MRYSHIFALVWLIGLLSIFAFSKVTKVGPDKSYPQGDFIAPTGGGLKLSGTFGELRSNHFHAGIDIKAKDGRVGEEIYAIAEGYVSRIKVQSGGYGNVLYVNHPNGYTSVYAHLLKFPEQVEAYVRSQQYSKRSFEVDLFPSSSKFLVKQGEVIGWLGVSGRSFGPHLHFEIRDTKSEKPINPLYFGFKVTDTRAPIINQFKIYGLDDQHQEMNSKEYKVKRSKDGSYRVTNDTLAISAWRVGLAIKAYDLMDGVRNYNGIYSLKMYVDDVPYYGFRMETFAFSQSRYINAHLDYEEQVREKSYYHRCYLMHGNKAPLYTPYSDFTAYNGPVNQGVIPIYKEKPRKIKIVVSDLEGNQQIFKTWIKRKEVLPPKAKTYNYLLNFDAPNLIQLPSIQIKFPDDCLYQDLYLNYFTSQEQNERIYSPIYHIHDKYTPVHRYYSLSIDGSSVPNHLKRKSFIGYCDTEDKYINCGGEWDKDGFLQTKVRDLGDFSILVDTVPPEIVVVDFSENMKNRNSMSFKISDDFSYARNVKGIHYEALVDGQWILFELDAKNDLITHHFDDHIKGGKHELVLRVWDGVGNEQLFKSSFIR